MKKKKLLKLLVIAIIFILFIFIFREIFIYKTIEEVLSGKIDEETEVKGIIVSIGQNNWLKRKITPTIKDQETMTTILEGFRNMELKKLGNRSDIDRYDLDYSLQIIAKNQVAEKHYSTETVHLFFDENYLDVNGVPYEIISESHHTDVIEEILNNDEIEWDEY
ncbi:hypothetical protein [Ornithinibacillus californiensis]|uniref:hypothetical protein n=1 Tax=Ornithinibacillus californiensis TaxID=161536 RepID=UPI00064D8231|nr:hypothetical protein [Ornithinibacillus californiensis]